MTDTVQIPEPTTPRRPARREDVAVMLIGLWLMFCPPTLKINDVALDTYTLVLTGVVLIVLGGTAMRLAKEWVEWGVAVAGTFLVIAPWVLGFTLKAATINAVACGVAAAALAGWRIYEIRSKPAERPAAAAKPAGEPRRAA